MTEKHRSSHRDQFSGMLELISRGGLSLRRKWILTLVIGSALVHLACGGVLFMLDFFTPLGHLQFVHRSYAKMPKPPRLMTMSYPAGLAARGSRMKVGQAGLDNNGQSTARDTDQDSSSKQTKPETALEKNKMENQDSSPTAVDTDRLANQLLEINEAPLNDVVLETVTQFKAAGINLHQLDFTLSAASEVGADGSLSLPRIVQSSGSAVIDRQAQAALWALGESRALELFPGLRSLTFRLELAGDTARLTATGRSDSADDARVIAQSVGVLIVAAQLFLQPQDTALNEVLAGIQVKPSDERVVAYIAVSRQRVFKLLEAQLPKVDHLDRDGQK